MRRKQYSKTCHAWQWLATVLLCLLATSLWSMGWAAPGDSGVRNNQVGIGTPSETDSETIRLGNGESIAKEKYLLDCGQACAYQNAAEVMTVLEKLNGEGKTVILVTHSGEIAARANHLVKVRDGRIEAA